MWTRNYRALRLQSPLVLHRRFWGHSHLSLPPSDWGLRHPVAFIGHPSDQRSLNPCDVCAYYRDVRSVATWQIFADDMISREYASLSGWPSLNGAREKVHWEEDSSAWVTQGHCSADRCLAILTEAEGLEKQGKCGDHVCSINQRRITIQMDAFLPLTSLIFP